MIELNVPGKGVYQLDHLVCDLSGTLTVDGKLVEGVMRTITTLKDRLQVHIISADTYGHIESISKVLNLSTVRIQPGNEAEQKADYVRQLGAERVIAIGQGANDHIMLAEAAIGICILSPEGLATSSLASANIVMPDILSALELLLKPIRLVATLRT
ncbi:MAG: ATPase P [Anaerolineae bacterium]|nr:ATPase P [Anaerolineae bacterium]